MHDLTKEIWVDYNYEDWLIHFKENDKARLQIDFSEEPVLTEEQRKLIFKSIKAFQMGEHSDGVYLAKLAEKFGKEFNQPHYAETMNLFIKEENFHSAYLAWYLKHHNEPKAKKNKLDKVFRDLRHNGKIFTEIAVLVSRDHCPVLLFRTRQRSRSDRFKGPSCHLQPDASRRASAYSFPDLYPVAFRQQKIKEILQALCHGMHDGGSLSHVRKTPESRRI